MIISKEWTSEERLKLISEIAKKMRTIPAVTHSNELLDIQERLMFLSLGSAAVLEINRESIINGNNTG